MLIRSQTQVLCKENIVNLSKGFNYKYFVLEYDKTFSAECKVKNLVVAAYSGLMTMLQPRLVTGLKQFSG